MRISQRLLFSGEATEFGQELRPYSQGFGRGSAFHLQPVCGLVHPGQRLKECLSARRDPTAIVQQPVAQMRGRDGLPRSARMYLRFRADNPVMSGKSRRKSAESRSITRDPHPFRAWRSRISRPIPLSRDRRDVPDPRRVIPRGRHHPLPIGAELRGIDRAIMLHGLAERFACRRVPDPRRQPRDRRFAINVIRTQC